MNKKFNPLVSVVIPTFNRKHFLETALNSLYRQTYKNLEIIIVDDASSDGTSDFVTKEMKKDSRIQYIHHARNQGGGKARNTGINAAYGDYVTFLDSDDEYLPEKIAKQVNAARDLPNDRAQVIQCQILMIRDGKPRFRPPIPIKGQDQSAADYLFLGGGQSYTPTLMVSTAHAKRILYNEKLPKLQDVDFFIRIFDGNPAYTLVPEQLATYNYFHRDNQISGSVPPYNIMKKWADSLGDRLDSRTSAFVNVNLLAFYASHERKHLTVLSALSEGARYGVIQERNAKILLARTLLPKRLYHSLKSSFRNIA